MAELLRLCAGLALAAAVSACGNESSEPVSTSTSPDPSTTEEQSEFTSTGSGLKYRYVRSGDSAGETVSESDLVCVHYRGALQDGTEFDSSYERGEPTILPVDQLIPGWREGLQLMRPGDELELVVPPGLGYGEAGVPPRIGPNATLIFDVELLNTFNPETLAGPLPDWTNCADDAFPDYTQRKADALAQAEQFLAQNASRDGVITTESGLQYQITESGPEEGPMPELTDFVCVHYRGALPNGTEFDSSYQRGSAITFGVENVIPGWTEALQLMRPGDVWQLTVPPELGYGEFGSGELIGPNAVLQFDVELFDVRSRNAIPGQDCADPDYLELKRTALAEAEAFLAENREREGVIETDSGLQYRILEEGPEDGPHPENGQYVCVHYRGELLNGEEFDSSYARELAAAFPSNRLIPGWVEALKIMTPGDKWQLFIHPKLGYSDAGAGDAIGPNQLLNFEVEMIKLLDGPVEQGVDCAADDAGSPAEASDDE